MSLTKENIVTKLEEYFSSDIAVEPAFITGEEDYDEVYEEFYNRPDICVYKASDGRKCAVGCLIPETKYEPEWDSSEGIGVTGLPEHIQEYLGKENIPLLQELQGLHDSLARKFENVNKDHFGKYFLRNAKRKYPSIFYSI